ncbi:BlaI/MecI/CopY family transcriptional regulator [Candidatus Nomurabacteria bacterium]|nr:BlaI/MecI/CopY family transcriptional regulator [Candidatus Nomurabacteria bacterium]MCB9803303.1 BlaI/MecI/CopY family transcriptional regulator [Candidatus Nomurabacteria bacterium]
MKRVKLLGKLEQKVMNVLWSCKCSMTPREVLETLDDGHAYTTIMTIMTTLYEKGFLERDQQGKGYTYSVKSTMEEYAKNRLSSHFDEILNNFGDIAVAQFVQSLGDDPKNMKILQDAINKAKNKKKQ